MSGFGEAHDVYVVFGHVAMDFVTFPLGVDALYVEGADAVGGFVFDGSTWGSGSTWGTFELGVDALDGEEVVRWSLYAGRVGRFRFLSLRGGLLASSMCASCVSSFCCAVGFALCCCFFGS